MKFYGHLHRMNEDRLTKRIFNIINSSKLKTNWLKETQEDLKQYKITEEEIRDRQKFRDKIKKLNRKQEQKLQDENGQKTEKRNIVS